MAEILTTKGSAAALEDIIRRANKTVYLISYSFIISDSFITRLKQAVEKGIVINIVYGKSIRDDTFAQLKAMPNLKIFHYVNLHAKIFANETKCIVGSMNFSEASEINNTELGVLLSLRDDKDAFEDAVGHCKEIVDGASLERPMMPKSIIDENKSLKNKTNKEKEKPVELMGYCIRTRKRIPLNHERPYSSQAYSDWMENDSGDDECDEEYDHFTGEKSHGETYKAKPILSRNWENYQKAMGISFY